MNRNEEFKRLKVELDQYPIALNYTMNRTMAKVNAHKKRTFRLFVPAGLLLSLFISFVIVVNTMPSVAFAMSEVPILKSLVKAVSLDPNMKKAIENDYVQYVGQEQTVDGVTVRIEYMIVDAERISVFFSYSPSDTLMVYGSEFYDMDNKYIPGCITSSENGEKNDVLSEVRLDMVDGQMVPKEFILNLKFLESSRTMTVVVEDANKHEDDYIDEYTEPDNLIYVSFHLKPDSSFTEVKESITIDKWVEIGGQRIYLNDLSIFSTQTKLNIEVDAENSCIIKGLDIYFKDDKGNSYSTIKNGITGTSNYDNHNTETLWFDSSFFANSEKLTMYIEGIRVINKEKEYGVLDFENKTISNLPNGVFINQMEQIKDDLYLSFGVVSEKPNHTFSIISLNYWDENGNDKNFNSWSHRLQDEYHFNVDFKIPNYNGGKYKFQWEVPELCTAEEVLVIDLIK